MKFDRYGGVSFERRQRVDGEGKIKNEFKNCALALSNKFFDLFPFASFLLLPASFIINKLLKRLNHRGNLHAVPASLKGKYVIRFTVTSTHTTNDDIIKDWSEIRLVASEICEESKDKLEKRVPLKGKRM